MARTRLKLLMLAVILPALAICWRLWSFQLHPATHQEYKIRAESAQLRTLQPLRGSILDRRGDVLAESRSGFDIHFVYSDLNPRHIVIEVVCEELDRIGDFPSAAEMEAGLAGNFDIEKLESLLRQRIPFKPEWVPLATWIPPAAAERIRLRLGPRRYFRDNFELRVMEDKPLEAQQAHFGLWFRPAEVFRMELTLRRLSQSIDRYDAEGLMERLQLSLQKIEVMVARDIQSDIQSGADALFTRKKERNSRRIFYRRGHLLAPDISLDSVSRIEYNPDLFPGIRIVDSSRRIYPHGEVFGALTGHLRQLNNRDLKILEESGRLLDRYPKVSSAEAFAVLRQEALRPNDVVGEGGLEEQYDLSLRGEYGMRLQQVGKNGRGGKLLASLSSTRGNDIHTTIDSKLQELLYRQLWAECAHHGHAAASAALMEIPSGAILASTAYPGYDPNRIRDANYHKEMNASLGSQTSDWLLDRPRSKALYPGSIFKIVTAIAALENGADWEGAVDPLRKYECRVGERKPFSMRCSSRYGHGHLNLYEAFEASCNNYFYYLAARHLDAGSFNQWARKLGCGDLTGIDLPTMGGSYDRGFLKNPEDVKGEKALCMYGIGQVQVQMTPLQALRMVGAVAAGLKTAPRPWLVKKKTPDKIYTRNSRTAAIVQECMKRVVSGPHGTVHGKFGLEDFNFAAKTGTAQYKSNNSRYHSWMVGYGPLPDPSIAFVVVCEKSRLGGGDACSPIVRELMEYLAGGDPRFLANQESSFNSSRETGAGR